MALTVLKDELTYETYMKIVYLFHTDFDGSILGYSSAAGAGVFAFIVVPSSVKFLGEWPEDKKNEVIAEMESRSSCLALWVDNWNSDTEEYVIHDELSNAIANLATTDYVNNAVNNIAFPPSLTEDQVNSLIDAKLGVIENGHY